MKKAIKNITEKVSRIAELLPATSNQHPATKAVLLLSLLLLAKTAFAAGPGTSSANFMKIGVGGRAVAMGEAQAAACEDSFATYWNPAVLGDLKHREASFMHNKHFQSISQQYLSYVHPTALNNGSGSRFGTFGGAITYVSIADIEGWDANDVKTEDLSASDTLMTFSWGKKLDWYRFLPGLNTGINIKYLNKKLGDDKATAVMADIGFLYEVKGEWLNGLKVALLSLNNGQDLTFIDEGSPLPQANKLGFAYPMMGNTLTIALDAVMPSDNATHLNFGVEYRVLDILSFRLGYKGQNDLDNGLTYGVGVGNSRMHIDYAFVPFGDLGDTHRVSFGIRFGSTYRRTQVNEQIKLAYLEVEKEYSHGNLIDAYIKASEILNIAPWHRPTQSFAALIRNEFKELADASKRAELKIQIDKHYEKGEQHFRLDELMAAKKEFKAILDLDPKHIGAKEYLIRIDNRFDDLVETFYENGMKSFAAGKYHEAKENFRRALVLNPKHADAQEQLELTEKRIAKIEAEEKEKAMLERVGPIFKQGLSSFQGKQYITAISKFETVLKLYPDHQESIRYIQLSKELLAKQYYNKGSELATAGQWDEASSAFRTSLKYDPNYSQAKKALAKVKGQMGKRKKEDSQNYYKQGLEAFLGGDKDKAKKLWQQAVELDPDNLEAKRGLERVSQNGR